MPPPLSRPDIRLGVDIGGTFTDVAMEVGRELFSIKLLTDHANPEQAILDAVAAVCRTAGIGFANIGLVIHGTTLAANALIERRGARTAFLTTHGFRDVVEIRTESRFDQYDLNLVVPPPLIAREDRFTVRGRIAASGRELEPLDEGAVVAFARNLDAACYESVAIGMIHSYVNPEHERRAAAIIAAEAPSVAVSVSSMAPTELVTDRLRAYGAAARELGLSAEHIQGKRKNNRVEGSHVPIRLRERKMQGFRSSGSAQRFLAAHAAVANTFTTCRHLISAAIHRQFRTEAFAAWREAAELAV